MNGQLCVVNAGEEAKSWDTLSSILEFLLMHKADQQSVLVVVGGGALSDVGGLAAALFKRGIRWVTVPTTLLAMVDASWGGKTAINFGGVKNSVGVYHWPSYWIYDLNMLHTLNMRQRFDGWVEMFKHAIIGDHTLLDAIKGYWMESEPRRSNIAGAMPLPSQDLIESALRVKIHIVQEDPFERDLRRLLNYGHTLAHALESSSNLYSHGQAVWLGMLFELQLALQCEMVAATEARFIYEFLDLLTPYSGYVDRSPAKFLPDWERIRGYLEQDKKVRFGQISWSLPVKVGQGQTGIEVDVQTVKKLYEIWSLNPYTNPFP